MRHFLIPSVRQMDCTKSAAAALAGLLGGYGLRASIEEIAAACGDTSAGIDIDNLQRVANERGLVCDQILIPIDHLLQPEAHAIPSIVLMRSPAGVRCAVLWRRHFGMVQLLDPSCGRRWLRPQTFLARVYRHSQHVSAHRLADWLRSHEFQGPLNGRMLKLGISDSRTLIANAACEPGWLGLACLDAVVRLIARQRLLDSVSAVTPAWTSVVRLWKESLQAPANIPNRFWFAKVPAEPERQHDATVQIRGLVALRMQRPSS